MHEPDEGGWGWGVGGRVHDPDADEWGGGGIGFRVHKPDVCRGVFEGLHETTGLQPTLEYESGLQWIDGSPSPPLRLQGPKAATAYKPPTPHLPKVHTR